MKPITKTLQRTDDLYIQFTDEELMQLNIQKGDKFSCECSEDGVILKKYVTLDIDISEWSREVLEMLISESLEKDITVNDVICDLLDSYLKNSCIKNG
jgi:hypothetical protein